MSSSEKPKGRKKMTGFSDMLPDNQSKSLSENLYKKNIELLSKNKTLSLLSQLYEISILTLEPKELAFRISQTVQTELSFEIVGIFISELESDSLVPLAFSKSQRVAATLKKLNLSFEEIKISRTSKLNFFNRVISSGKEDRSDNLKKVWGSLIDPVKLQIMSSEDHIKTTMLYPLMVQNKVLGVIMLSMNRSFEALNSFEKESIKSFANLIALALEKAFLYRELEIANAQLLELDHQKDAVLHMVAHQFKGPVTTINFTTELLLDGSFGKLTTEQKGQISTVRTAAQKMGLQSEMVLDAAKITLGKLPLEPQPVDLNELFTEIVSEAQNHARERKVKLKISLPSLKLPTAILDRKYTQLAIDNLLSNAVKYTAVKPENGSAEFTVTVKNKTLLCVVKDTGIGIPKKEQENIFKELYRASNAGRDGNGLGLHVTKGAIEAQGGKIWFESEEGKGTTFFVELPLTLETSTKEKKSKLAAKKIRK